MNWILLPPVGTEPLRTRHYSVDKRTEMKTGWSGEVKSRRRSVGEIAVLLFRIVGREKTSEEDHSVQADKKGNQKPYSRFTPHRHRLCECGDRMPAAADRR